MNRILCGGVAVALFGASAWAADPVRGVAADAVSDEATTAATRQRRARALQTIVVTASRMDDPYRLETDPRQPRLPLPAHDGGSYLKSIPGFALSRKGGTSGDPELRGLGGSRLNILVDGAASLGGCGNRMDPPTAYVFPEAYDRIEVLKGPQSVRDGASGAGIVRFERSAPVFDGDHLSGYASGTVGRFGRRDATVEVIAAAEQGFARFTGTWSEQDDYRGGDGRRVHSGYERWSGSGVFGWRADSRTLIELSLDRSDAEAAYDDRGMDGTRFAREGYQLRLVREPDASPFQEVEAMVYWNDVDHVMDNFTLREVPMAPMVSYPDRRTRGFRLSAELLAREVWQISMGVDGHDDRHRDNRIMGPTAFEFREVPRNDNVEFRDVGLYTELERPVGPRGRLAGGVRIDRSRAEVTSLSGLGGAAAGDVDRSGQVSGFVRYSHAFENAPLVAYAGLGRAERAADFWERRRDFSLSTETLTQLDAGLRFDGARVAWTLATFYGGIDDYVLISAPGIAELEARNVDATTYGGELDATVRLGAHLQLVGTAAWVRSTNDTDDVPLAQTPPLEGSLGVDYDDGAWFTGVLTRLVARQTRVHPGHGTVYSLDSAPSPGFGVLSAYGGYRLASGVTFTAGVDNLFNRNYAEHIQRGLADLGARPTRIPEPGRGLWVRVNAAF